MLDTKAVLVRAREMIADPEHWVQDNYATDNTGAPADLFAPERPYCMCLVGAVDRAAVELAGMIDLGLTENDDIGDIESGVAGGAITQLQQLVPGLVSDFNDNHETTHADVLALLDKAIAA